MGAVGHGYSGSTERNPNGRTEIFQLLRDCRHNARRELTGAGRQHEAGRGSGRSHPRLQHHHTVRGHRKLPGDIRRVQV